jgi:hypothetical protein
MPLPRVRFTVRRLMIAVAIVALILGAELTRRRSVQFRLLARSYAAAAEFDGLILGGGTTTFGLHDGQIRENRGGSSIRILADEGTIEFTIDAALAYDADRLRRRAEYHGLLRRKYDRAARHPWLPVEPVPPEPE